MERKNIEEFLEIILIVHVHPFVVSKRQIQRLFIRRYIPYSPRLHLFPRMKLFSRLMFWRITLSFGSRHPPPPLFLPQNSRDIRVTSHGSLTGALPLKPLPRPFTRFLLLSHSSIYSYSFSDLSLPDFDGNETSFQWHLLFVDRAKNSPPIFPIILPCEIAKPIRFVILNMCF